MSPVRLLFVVDYRQMIRSVVFFTPVSLFFQLCLPLRLFWLHWGERILRTYVGGILQCFLIFAESCLLCDGVCLWRRLDDAYPPGCLQGTQSLVRRMFVRVHLCWCLHSDDIWHLMFWNSFVLGVALYYK